ncbi:MAG: J domain-containing protein [Bacteroidota bacterium]
MESTLPILVGAVLSAALVGSALLGWLGDLKRVGSATSARETTRRATTGSPRPRPRPKARAHANSTSGPRPAQSARSASREQEERIRDAYFAKERKAREERERRRREQARQRRTRQSAPGSGSRQTAPPPSGSEESRHRATLELTGPITKDSVRAAYRRLIAAYHPDRCATLGLKLRKLAEEETKRINEAYAYFRRQLK